MSEKELMTPEKLQKIYTDTFAGEQGEKCLEDLGKRCYAFASTFNSDINHMAFNEGRRSIYLEIKAIMGMDVKRVTELQNKLKAGGSDE